jgi:serpin B
MKLFALVLVLSPQLAMAQELKPIANSINAFGLDAYYQISQREDYVISPISISSAIAMTYAGALGETKEQIKKVFYYDDDSTLNKGFSDLSRILNQPYAGTTVAVANKLWADKRRIELDPNFIRVNKEYYAAGLETLDLGNVTEASKSINDWVSLHTYNKINDFLKPDFFSRDLILVLTNAVYFKSKWKNPFDPKLTIQKDFIRDSKFKKKASFMVNKGNYSTFENEVVRVLELPYTGNEFSFLILLPQNNINIKQVEDFITLENLNSWTSSLHTLGFTSIQIPKFKSSFELELNDMLTNLGMQNAFGPGAEFGGIGHANGNIILSKVVHQTFIEVNEEGAEAAAVTAVGAVARSMAPEPIEFIADHPFIYVLRHVKTNTILFIGKMSNPSSN